LKTVREHFAIQNVLWRDADHFNHVHVDFHPAGSGTPQCVGGSGGWESAGGSPALKAFRAELALKPDHHAPGGIGYFDKIAGTYDLGTFVCKKIAGTSEWSQHAFDNAQDVGVPDLKTGDAVVAWLDSEWKGDDEVSKQDVIEGLIDAFHVADQDALDIGFHTLLGIHSRMAGELRPAGEALAAGWDFADLMKKIAVKVGVV